MASSQIGIEIGVTNTSGPEFAKIQKALADLAAATKDFGKNLPQEGLEKFTKGVDATGRSLRDVLQPVKLFTENIAQQLNPALGNLVTGFGAASREGAKFSLAVAGLVVGTATVATGFAIYIERLNALTKAQNEANFAAKGFDTASLRGQLDGAVKAAEEFDRTWKAKFLANFGSSPAAQQSSSMFGKLLGAPDPAALAAMKKAFEEALPFETVLKMNQALAPLKASLENIASVEAQRAAQLGDTKSYLYFQQEIAVALTAQYQALQRVNEEEAQLERQQAIRRGTLALEGPGINQREKLRRQTLTNTFDALTLQQQFRQYDTEVALSNRLGTPESFAGSEEELAIQGGVRFAEQSAARQGANQAEILSAQVQARTQVLGLTREQRLEAELLTIEASKQLAIAQAKGKLDEGQLTNLAEAQAIIKTNQAIQQEAARQDPLLGLSLGFQDVVDDFTAKGQLLRDGIRSLGNDMSQSFSQTFTQAVMGDFKKLQDLPKLFAQNVLTAFSDTLGKAVIGNLFKSFQSGFGGAGGGGFFSVLGGGGGGAGGQLVQLGGQTFQAVQAGGGQSVLIPVGSASGAAQGGGFSLGQLPTPPSSIFQGAGTNLLQGSTFGAALNFPLVGIGSTDVVISGGQIISSAGDLAMGGVESAGIAGSAGTFAASATVGAALGVAGGIAGLGFTIFSALQGAPTAQNIAMSAISGAVAGAAIAAGLVAAGVLAAPTFGISLVVAAIAGALLGGGAAAMGKGGAGQKPSAAERSYQAGQIGKSNLSSAILAAKDLDTLRLILNTKWSPYNEVIIVSYDRPTHWVGSYTNGPAGFLAFPWADGKQANPYPDIITMLNDPRYIDNLEIQVAGTGGGGSAVYDATLTKQFQDKWNEILQSLAKGFFGFRENLGPSFDLLGPSKTSPTGAAVERFTVVPGSQFQLAAGQFPEVSLDQLKAAGLDDDEIEMFLRRLAQVNTDRDLNILVKPQEFAFG